MQTPEAVAAMQRLYGLGWGLRRIAEELGCSRNTVQHYVHQSGWVSYRSPPRLRKLAPLEPWRATSFRQQRGNADGVRQELQRGHGMTGSLRTVERAVQPWRQELDAEARATVRFETAPGRQLPIDFGPTPVPIGAERVTLHLFVATLGFSRRAWVRVFDHERPSAGLDGREGAFPYFGGLPAEVLLDTARAWVEPPDPTTRIVVFNPRRVACARYGGFQPRACAPYRARTQGKDERGVGYVKHHAIAGRTWASWAALEAPLSEGSRTVADVRIQGTPGEPPRERFQRAEAMALRPLNGRPPFHWTRELTRRVPTDSGVEVDTNHYSVPWRLIGATVTVRVRDDRMGIFHAGAEGAGHLVAAGRRQRRLEPAHLVGIVGAPGGGRPPTVPVPAVPVPAPALLRPWTDYEVAAGGGW